jgi:hypothetical protein
MTSLFGYALSAALLSSSATPVYAPDPLAFEANRGQAPPVVRFMAHGRGFGLYVTAEEAVFAVSWTDGSSLRAHPVVRLRLLGANPAAELVGMDPLPDRTDHRTGPDPSRWQTDVPVFTQVMSLAIYPGIDLIYRGTAEQLEYELVLAPDADPAAFGLEISGVERVRLDARGDLVVEVEGRTLRLARPRVRRDTPAGLQPVTARFILDDDRRVRLALADDAPAEPR